MGFLKEKVPSGSSGRGVKRGCVGGPLTLAGLRAGEFQASWFTNGWRGSRSAPEGVPRALGRRLRIAFMPLGASGLGAETPGGRAGP